MKYIIVFFLFLIPIIGNSKKKIEIPTNKKDSVNVSSSQLGCVKETRLGLHPSSSKIRQDQFLPDSITKSSLYIYIEKWMREELSIDEKTNNSKFPEIIINNQRSYLKDINDLEYIQMKKITLLSGNDPSKVAIYGARAIYGIIIIETE